MAQEESISSGTFLALAAAVVVFAVGVPLMARRAHTAGQVEPGVSAPPPAPVEPEPEPAPAFEPLPALVEEVRGTLTFDPEQERFELSTLEGKRVIPIDDVLRVEVAPGRDKQEFLHLKDHTKVRVPAGFVIGLPREVRYRFDYGRSGNVDPGRDTD